jgi:hypothetical protein
MVLLRYGRDGVTKGTNLSKQIYYEDSVWTTRREADKRGDQLKVAGYYPIIDEKKFTNAPTEYIVWRGESKRRGTRNYKKTVKRDRHKELLGEK